MTEYESLDDYCLDDHFILFPSGGVFNKLRAASKNSRYLDMLFKHSQAGYNAARSKKHFVHEEILDKIPGGLKVWRGKPDRGLLIALNGDDAYHKITQFMRDLRKRTADQRPYNSEVILRATRQGRQSPRKPAPKSPTVTTASEVTPAAKKKCTNISAKKKCPDEIAKDALPLTVNVSMLKDQLILSQKDELEALRREFERQKETISLQQQRIEELESQIFHMFLDNNNRILLQRSQSISAVAEQKDTNSMVEDKGDDNKSAVAHDGDEGKSSL